MLRQQEAVHGGGVRGSGVWVDEKTLSDWHLQNSIKYSGPFNPEYSQTGTAISRSHSGIHDASLTFKSAVKGIVPGYSGHVPRARDMYGTATTGGITPERGWKRNERTGQMLETTNRGPMGDRAVADGPEGAASRPHAFTRVHNRVSDEIKPGYAGHIPAARDTFGTSPFRDGYTHRTGKAKHHEVEDGAQSNRTTSSRRVLSARASSPSRSRSHNEADQRGRTTSASAFTPHPGLRDLERISGRDVQRRPSAGGRYFTLQYTPRQYGNTPRQVHV